MIVSTSLAKTELDFLNSILSKSYNYTLNALIANFKNGVFKFGSIEGIVFAKGEKVVTAQISDDNLKYLESVKIISKSHTLKLMLYFASLHKKAWLEAAKENDGLIDKDFPAL